MYNKTYRPTREDAIGINELIEKDVRIEKGQSQALYYAFKDAHEDGLAGKLKWEEIAKCRFGEDKEVDISEEEYSSARSFMVDEEDWDFVVQDFKTQLHIEKVRISYLTRLCIIAARMRLLDNSFEEKTVKVKIKNLDAAELEFKVHEKVHNWIKNGKYEKVQKILEEED